MRGEGREHVQYIYSKQETHHGGDAVCVCVSRNSVSMILTLQIWHIFIENVGIAFYVPFSS